MERLNQIIAENLKEIRKGKGLSLEQASALTSISKSMLSQLERGEVNPTISTVYKLSLGLKVPVTAFTLDKPKPLDVYKRQLHRMRRVPGCLQRREIDCQQGCASGYEGGPGGEGSGLHDGSACIPGAV